MQDAVDALIAAFNPHSCRAVIRHADRTVIFTVTDKESAATLTKVIPFTHLECETSLCTIIQNLHRDLDHSIGVLSSASIIDIRLHGARITRF